MSKTRWLLLLLAVVVIVQATNYTATVFSHLIKRPIPPVVAIETSGKQVKIQVTGTSFIIATGSLKEKVREEIALVHSRWNTQIARWRKEWEEIKTSSRILSQRILEKGKERKAAWQKDKDR